MQCPPTIRIGNNSQFTFLNPTHAFHFISPAHVYGSIFQPINKYTYTIYNTTMRVYINTYILSPPMYVDIQYIQCHLTERHRSHLQFAIYNKVRFTI